MRAAARVLLGRWCLPVQAPRAGVGRNVIARYRNVETAGWGRDGASATRARCQRPRRVRRPFRHEAGSTERRFPSLGLNLSRNRRVWGMGASATGERVLTVTWPAAAFLSSLSVQNPAKMTGLLTYGYRCAFLAELVTPFGAIASSRRSRWPLN